MSSQANQPLPEGFQLENYRVLRLIASGGFSFVYLAHDENETPVAIKEYLPATLALRTADNPSPVVPEENLATFRYGLKCFFEEGRALATLSHPNVVRVINFFRANDTVYLVMRYERGRTLQEHIHKKTGPIKEEWIRGTFTQLLNGLRDTVTGAIAARKETLADAALDARLASETIDVTLPARPENAGTVHPISQVLDEVTAIFAGLGFAVELAIAISWPNFSAAGTAT